MAIPPSVWSNCVVYWPIQWKGQVKYLGNIISCDLSGAYDIKANTNVFISQVNTLNNKFSGVTCNVRGKLLQSYCCTWYTGARLGIYTRKWLNE